MSPTTMQALMIGATLFTLGMVGFLSRRNLILMFLSLELMLAGVSTNFVAFGYQYGNFQGQLFAILILTVASCEAALALALVVALYRRKPTLDIWSWGALREADGPHPSESERATKSVSPADDNLPNLTPAGRDPLINPISSHFEADPMTPKA